MPLKASSPPDSKSRSPFGLDYDPDKINPQHTYALQVRITVDDQLRFLNMAAYPVITRGHPTTVELVVDPVS
ncbi:MAG: hypothetical protein HC895_04360 [Leptolyngbyaceae cyanobacterium SM1_3_5]|nr:hypothetical protein [Leptolyngbyaceae cyanobacterium SM1_3_5]